MPSARYAEIAKDLPCPLIGLFGNDDRAPSPEQVNQHDRLKNTARVTSSIAMTAPATVTARSTRPEQAMDGWSKLFAFFGKHLGK